MLTPGHSVCLRTPCPPKPEQDTWKDLVSGTSVIIEQGSRGRSSWEQQHFPRQTEGTGRYRLRATFKWKTRKGTSGTSCHCGQQHRWQRARPSFGSAAHTRTHLSFPKSLSVSLGHQQASTPALDVAISSPEKAMRGRKAAQANASLWIIRMCVQPGRLEPNTQQARKFYC